MKKLLIVLWLMPFFCHAQDEMIENFIPVIDGKVVFSSEYNLEMNKQDIRIKLKNWLENSFLQKNGTITLDDTVSNIIVCRKIDELEISRKIVSHFTMTMRYTLVLEYKDNYCLATIKNISYIDPDELPRKGEKPTVYSAEMILIEKKFTNLFITDASDQITSKTLDRIEAIFQDIKDQFFPKKQEIRQRSWQNRGGTSQ